MQISSLHYYPIKSCRGVAALALKIDELGPVDDRRFLIVDANGRSLTQRERPQMARILIRPAPGGWLVSIPGQELVSLPRSSPGDSPAREVTVWRDTVLADDCGEETASCFSGFLGEPVRLVRVGRGFSRAVAAERTPAALAGGATAPCVAFSDAFPFLITSIASIGDLNSRLDEPLPMDRFRPNIVVSGCEPFEEDAWQRIRIGGIVFHAAGPCGRCVVTTTDQHDGTRQGKEPLATLATYRRGPDGAVNFGQNFIHEPAAGTIRVGDPVTILERRPSSGATR